MSTGNPSFSSLSCEKFTNEMVSGITSLAIKMNELRFSLRKDEGRIFANSRTVLKSKMTE